MVRVGLGLGRRRVKYDSPKFKNSHCLGLRFKDNKTLDGNQ